MNDVDRWAAEQCGITLYSIADDYMNEDSDYTWINGANVKWTIQDPRCREVIFDSLIETEKYRSIIEKFTYYWVYKRKYLTKQEYEIACIQAIYERGVNDE